MDKTVTAEQTALPQAETEVLPPDEATTPVEEGKKEAYLQIKFNKELIDLDREEAVTLAQKGMKYDHIYEDYERLRALEVKGSDGIETLCREFPEISSVEMVPEEVKTAAEKSNRGLLFEYLLYEHRQRRAAAAEEKNQSFTAFATTGSLSADDRQDPTAAEFLRGVWGR